MPKSVIRRAGSILKNLEKNDAGVGISIKCLFLISKLKRKKRSKSELPDKELEKELRQTDPNELSPFEALVCV